MMWSAVFDIIYVLVQVRGHPHLGGRFFLYIIITGLVEFLLM
jgi:hypothetical protein